MSDDEWDADWDEDDDEFFAAWAEADRDASEVLRLALDETELAQPAPRLEVEAAAASLRRGVAGGAWPWDYFVNACGWPEALPEHDHVAWVGAVASTISPPFDPGTEAGEQAAVMAMEHADWVGLVVGLVRRGVGAEFAEDTWRTDIADLPEIEGVDEVDEGDGAVYSSAVEVLAPLWTALGVLDDDRCLTPLGRWGLPHGLLVVWAGGTKDDGRPAGGDDELDEESAGVALGLLARGPRTYDRLRRDLAEEGIFTDTERLERSLQWRMEVYRYDDGSVGHLPALAEGAILTHRLNADEIESGVLDAALDLTLWHLAALDGLPLSAGGEVKSRFAIDALPMPGTTRVGLAGPAGWLEGFGEGDLLGLRWFGGTLEVSEVAATDDPEARTTLIRAAQDAAAWSHEDGDPNFPGTDGAEICLRALRDHAGVLARPLPPLSEILAESGLELHDGSVGVPGTPWHGEPTWLDDAERSAYRDWLRALAEHRRGELLPAEELATVVEGLAGAVADLAAVDLADEAMVDPLLRAMQEAVTGPAVAVPLYLLSRAAEARGDGATVLARLEECVAADPGGEDALGDLADLRAIAGDAREARRLYTLAGLDPAMPEVAALRPFLVPPVGDVGRNHRCPCGSGKKYKLCHGRTDRHPLADRGVWLWAKIRLFAQRSINRQELLDWAEVASGAPRDDRRTLALAMQDDTVLDFATYDGGLLGEFLGLYGDLMPADERELAEGWLDTERLVLEVAEVRPMRGVVCRDLLTEETYEVSDRRLARAVEVKDLLYARLVDPGDGTRCTWVTPLGVPRQRRPRLVDLLRADVEPEELLEFLLQPPGPPQLVTADGEELLICTARYRLGDPEATWATLSERLEVVDATGLQLTAESRDGGSSIRGSVTRDDDLLVLEALSLERLRVLQHLLLEADPEARLQDESSRSPAELLAEGAPDRRSEPVPDLPADLPAEVPAEVMRQLARSHEDRWLDDHVPALGGLTPREAAADPARRRDLLALLDDFEWQDRRNPSPFGMDVDRIRAGLGLTDRPG